MYPTLRDNDYVLINKCSVGFRMPRNIFEIPWIGTLYYYCCSETYVSDVLHRTKNENFTRWGMEPSIKKGDIIVFNNPFLMKSYVVKRCIALPGDSILHYLKDVHSPWITPFSIVPYKGMKVYEKNLSLAEKKVMKQNRLFQYLEKDSVFIAKNNGYFVLGDNRAHSEDSRLWGIISEDLIVGKLELIIKRDD